MPRPLIPSPFDDATADCAVVVGVVDVHAAPDETSEVVTQALLGTPLIVQDAESGWRLIQLPDYTGWIPKHALSARTPASEGVAVVTSLRAPLSVMRNTPSPFAVPEVYATTVLPLIARSDDEPGVIVALARSRSGTLSAADCVLRPAAEPFPRRSVEEMLAFARSLLGVPYKWGGVTALGIDCSGLAQLCCRYAGVPILRDSAQQYASIPHMVERGDLRAGDLAFFARDGRIVHVGIMLDGCRMLHADGSVRHQVTIDALDPAAEDYSARLAHLYAGARRPLLDGEPA